MTTDANRTIAGIIEAARPVLEDVGAIDPPRGDRGNAAPRQDGSSDQAGAQPPNIPTEDSVARLFVDRHCGRWRYDQTLSAWFEFVGTHWSEDRTSRIVERVRELARELATGRAPAERRELERRRFIMAVERLASSDERVAVTSDDWDANDWLLGTPGGVLELKTGRLRPAEPSDGITKITSVAPAVEEHCPTWRKFLHEVTNGDPDYERFLRQWCGYCLTGSTREHSLLFVFGQGGRGKGTFITVITNILREYALTTPIETFTDSHVDRHPTEIARLRGARLVTASETEQGRAWAEAKLKSLTGGDKISARFMRADSFEFLPKFKLVILGNHQPSLRNVGDAERRRFKLAPFDFKPEAPDRTLVDRLACEADGILTWMVNGCLDWQENGFVTPKVISEATEDYFERQDSFGAWLKAEVDHNPGSTSGFETSEALYASWKAYAGRIGEREGTMKAFSAKLKSRGFIDARKKHARGWHGLRLLSQAHGPASADDPEY